MPHTTCKSSPLNLSAPHVPQAHQKGIGLAAAAHLIVHIDPYSGMDEGDLVELLWGGCYVTSKTVSAQDVGQPLALRVPESFVENGKVKISYRVMKIGGVPETAPHSTFWVKLDLPGGQLIDPDAEENQGLEPLLLPESIVNEGLQPIHLRDGLLLTIAPYMNMAPRDEITVRWGDLRMDLPTLDPGQVNMPITFTVPPDVIREACIEDAQEMTYCIIDRAGNNSRWAPARLVNTSKITPTGH
jgi:hypothetical protein